MAPLKIQLWICRWKSYSETDADLPSLTTFESRDFTTYVTLSRVGNWFLTLSRNVKLPKIFGAVGLISKLDIDR